MLEKTAHPPTSPPLPRQTVPKPQLTLFDSTCIIVGIIIGASIYESSPLIASQVPGFGWLLGVWLLGGLFSFLGALCYAELATAYPASGGDYVYLSRAFGRAAGFLFAWSQLWVVRPGSIGAMAYVFARYANQLWPWLGQQASQWWPGHPQRGESAVLMFYAVLSIVVLSGINILGVRQGKWTQNLLTTIKVLGLAAIMAVGFAVGAPQMPHAVATPAETPSLTLSGFNLAMILVLFAYGGWNEMAYVAAEVRNPRKNIVRALILGTGAVTLIYVLVTAAFVHALGLEGSRNSQGVAAEVLGFAIGPWAARVISLLICISALGAINGQIFTGARIYYAMGTDHRLYAWLGRWNQRRGTPVWSLAIQAIITLALVLAFGWLQMTGRSSLSGFSGMVVFTAPAFWFFLVLVGVSVAELRSREPNVARPYRVPGYPVVPILFCLSSLFMLYSTLVYAIQNQSWEAIWSVALLAAGVPMCFFDPKPREENG